MDRAPSDSGIGIASSDRELVFDRFYRAPNADAWTRTAAQGGSGLGLAIVRSIAGSHNAGIALRDACPENEALPGTIMQVTFPLAVER